MSSPDEIKMDLPEEAKTKANKLWETGTLGNLSPTAMQLFKAVFGKHCRVNPENNLTTEEDNKLTTEAVDILFDGDNEKEEQIPEKAQAINDDTPIQKVLTREQFIKFMSLCAEGVVSLLEILGTVAIACFRGGKTIKSNKRSHKKTKKNKKNKPNYKKSIKNKKNKPNHKKSKKNKQ